MTRTLSLLLALTACAPEPVPDAWVKVATDVYVKRSDQNRMEPQPRVTVRVKSDDPGEYYLVRVTIDCFSETLQIHRSDRYLRDVFISGGSTKDKVWYPIHPNTPAKAMYKAICGDMETV